MDEPAQDPLALVKQLVLLIVEARTPDASVKGRVEGPHCPIIRGGPPHHCAREKWECVRAREFCHSAQQLWTNGIPILIDILLFPECPHGWEEVMETEGTVTSVSKENALLVERWSMVSEKRRHDNGLGSNILLQAVRSYLHFSQISSWLYSEKGKLPNLLAYRIYAPGEESSLNFPSHPDFHAFPLCVSRHDAIKVSVSALERLPQVPVLLCAQEVGQKRGTAASRESDAEEGQAMGKLPVSHTKEKRELKDDDCRPEESGMAESPTSLRMGRDSRYQDSKAKGDFGKKRSEGSRGTFENNSSLPDLGKDYCQSDGSMRSANGSRFMACGQTDVRERNVQNLCGRATGKEKKCKGLTKKSQKRAEKESVMQCGEAFQVEGIATKQCGEAFQVEGIAEEKQNTKGRFRKKDDEKDRRIEQMKSDLASCQELPTKTIKGLSKNVKVIGPKDKHLAAERDNNSSMLMMDYPALQKEKFWTKFSQGYDEANFQHDQNANATFVASKIPHERTAMLAKYESSKASSLDKWSTLKSPDWNAKNSGGKPLPMDTDDFGGRRSNIAASEAYEEEFIRRLSERMSLAKAAPLKKSPSPDVASMELSSELRAQNEKSKMNERMSDFPVISSTQGTNYYSLGENRQGNSLSSQQRPNVSPRITDVTQKALPGQIFEEPLYKVCTGSVFRPDSSSSFGEPKTNNLLSQLTVDISCSELETEWDSDDTPTASPNHLNSSRFGSDSLLKAVTDKQMREAVNNLANRGGGEDASSAAPYRCDSTEESVQPATDFASKSNQTEREFQDDFHPTISSSNAFPDPSQTISPSSNIRVKNAFPDPSQTISQNEEESHQCNTPFSTRPSAPNRGKTTDHLVRSQCTSRKMFQENLLPLASYDAQTDSFKAVDLHSQAKVLHSPKVLLSCQVPTEEAVSSERGRCINFEEEADSEVFMSRLQEMAPSHGIPDSIGDYMSCLAAMSLQRDDKEELTNSYAKSDQEFTEKNENGVRAKSESSLGNGFSSHNSHPFVFTNEQAAKDGCKNGRQDSFQSQSTAVAVNEQSDGHANRGADEKDKKGYTFGHSAENRQNNHSKLVARHLDFNSPVAENRGREESPEGVSVMTNRHSEPHKSTESAKSVSTHLDSMCASSSVRDLVSHPSPPLSSLSLSSSLSSTSSSSFTNCSSPLSSHLSLSSSPSSVDIPPSAPSPVLAPASTQSHACHQEIKNFNSPLKSSPDASCKALAEFDASPSQTESNRKCQSFPVSHPCQREHDSSGLEKAETAHSIDTSSANGASCMDPHNTSCLSFHQRHLCHGNNSVAGSPTLASLSSVDAKSQRLSQELTLPGSRSKPCLGDTYSADQANTLVYRHNDMDESKDSEKGVASHWNNADEPESGVCCRRTRDMSSAPVSNGCSTKHAAHNTESALTDTHKNSNAFSGDTAAVISNGFCPPPNSPLKHPRLSSLLKTKKPGAVGTANQARQWAGGDDGQCDNIKGSSSANLNAIIKSLPAIPSLSFQTNCDKEEEKFHDIHGNADINCNTDVLSSSSEILANPTVKTSLSSCVNVQPTNNSKKDIDQVFDSNDKDTSPSEIILNHRPKSDFKIGQKEVTQSKPVVQSGDVVNGHESNPFFETDSTKSNHINKSVLHSSQGNELASTNAKANVSRLNHDRGQQSGRFTNDILTSTNNTAGEIRALSSATTKNDNFSYDLDDSGDSEVFFYLEESSTSDMPKTSGSMAHRGSLSSSFVFSSSSSSLLASAAPFSSHSMSNGGKSSCLSTEAGLDLECGCASRDLDQPSPFGRSRMPSYGDDLPGWSPTPPSRSVSTPDCAEGEVRGRGYQRSTCNRSASSVMQQDNDGVSARRAALKSSSMIFNSRTALPTQSSPAPLKRKPGGRFDYDASLLNVRAIKSAFSCSKLALGNNKGGDDNEENTRTLSTSAPASTNCLLGNFEESILNGRIDPVGTVDGFSAEIGASGSFCPKHLHLPVSAFFFALSDDNAPSPYLGHINLTSVSKKGYHIPKKGTVQVTLFNPNKTVVKMFVVMYDLSDMPPSSQTFIRQRTMYIPCDRNSTAPTYLRYLIHLRCSSSRSGKIYLHTDIRLIFARHKLDIDAKTVPYEMKSFTDVPRNPKYSPKK